MFEWENETVRELSHRSGQNEELRTSSLEDWGPMLLFIGGTPSLLWTWRGGQIQGKPSYVCGYSDDRLGQHWCSWWWSLERKVCRSRENPQIPTFCLGFRAEFSAPLFVFYSKRTNYLIIHFIDRPLFIFTIKFNSWVMCLERWATIANNEIEE